MRLALSVCLAIGAVAAPGGVSAEDGWIDCAAEPAQTISGTVTGNVRIGDDNTICQITGTVEGNVLVSNDSASCDQRPPFTAALISGTVRGNIRSEGGPCVMVWLVDGARVEGNVVFGSAGNLGFLAESTGSTVTGNVVVNGGLLWATGASTTNGVDGHVICAGGEPLGGSGSASATDWDGVDGDTDGSIGKGLIGC